MCWSLAIRTDAYLTVNHACAYSGHLCFWVTLLNLLYLLQMLTDFAEIWWLVCNLTSQCWCRISLKSDVVCRSYGNVYRVIVFSWTRCSFSLKVALLKCMSWRTDQLTDCLTLKSGGYLNATWCVENERMFTNNNQTTTARHSSRWLNPITEACLPQSNTGTNRQRHHQMWVGPYVNSVVFAANTQHTHSQLQRP